MNIDESLFSVASQYRAYYTVSVLPMLMNTFPLTGKKRYIFLMVEQSSG